MTCLKNDLPNYSHISCNVISDDFIGSEMYEIITRHIFQNRGSEIDKIIFSSSMVERHNKEI